MNSSYFTFEFECPQQPNPIQAPNANAFANDQIEDWYNWQHSEIDADDSYEYSQMKKRASTTEARVKYLLTPLAQYEYLKYIKRRDATQTIIVKVDNSIFTDYVSSQRRPKSTSGISQQTINTYRVMLEGLINQKKVFASLLA
jgi:hypothetical protein